MTLQTKIISTVILISVSVNMIFLYNFISSKKKGALIRLDQKIENTSILLNQVNSVPLYEYDLSKLETNLKSFLKDSEIRSISLKEINGDVDIHFEKSELNDQDIIEKKTTIYYDHDEIGEIVTTYTTSHINKQLSESITQIIISFIFVTFIISLVLYLLLKKITKPITDLTELSSEIASGNLEKEIKIVSHDEIGILSQSLMTMRDSIKQKIHALKLENEERKQTEEKLRHLRNYLTNIIDSMPSVLVGVDVDGKITQWNTKAQETSGVPVEEAIGQPLDKIIQSLSKEMERIRKAMQTQEVLYDSRQPRKIDGETRYEDVTVYPLLANGVEGAVIRIDDVTEQVRLEEMMIQSEKMLSVGGLAAGMAHEINNPLAGMMQTANVMVSRLGEQIDIPANLKAAEAAGTTMEAIQNFMEARDIPRMLTTINESGRRVAAIVDNMLSFARESDSSTSSHDLSDLLDKTLELAATDYDLKKHFDFKMIEIKKEYTDNLPPLPCDGAKIQQVLLNILRNGAQAMQETGTVKPCLIVRTRFEKEWKMVCMEIEDNGPGMDETTRKRVFEPFFTTKPVGVGTGLGLSVSYFIITEKHGGEMRVESTLGMGTKFIIKLPVQMNIA